VARILIIDDEPLVALMIRRTLEDAHAVTVASSARGALALFQQGERFDAIVSDLNMPDGGGIWLRGELERLDPALSRRMLFLTGGSMSAGSDAFLRQPGVRWMQKPFRSAELMGRLAELLSGT
jgi:two-component system NtrC family sensor kinase